MYRTMGTAGCWLECPIIKAIYLEESTELANIMIDINTYRDKMTLKLIMGQEPLSKFEDFVETIKGMGIDRAIEIKQAAIDRYYNR